MAAMASLYRISGFRGEYFSEIDQPKRRITNGGHVC